jgi:flagellar hook-associated protein 3 FlgL
MRVSSQQIYNAGIESLSQHAADLAKAQRQVSSGKRYALASESPLAAGLAVQVSLGREQFAMFKVNQDYASATLSTTDSVLENISNMLLRVKQLVLQSENDALDIPGRQAIGREIEQLSISIEKTAQLNGQDGKLLLREPGNLSELSVAPGISLLPGIFYEAVMGVSEPGGTETQFPGGAVDILELLDSLKQELLSGRRIIQSDLPLLDQAFLQVNTARSIVGIRGNQLDSATEISEAYKLNIEAERAALLDADLVESVTQISKSTALLQAAQAVVSKITINALFTKL